MTLRQLPDHSWPAVQTLGELTIDARNVVGLRRDGDGGAILIICHEHGHEVKVPEAFDSVRAWYDAWHGPPKKPLSTAAVKKALAEAGNVEKAAMRLGVTTTQLVDFISIRMPPKKRRP